MRIPFRTRAADFLLNRKEHLESFLLFLLAVAAFLVRVWGISKVHFWDEMVYLQNAQVICCGKLNYTELDSRPPLISLIFAGVFRLWHHIYAACIVTAILNALGPVFLYLAGRRLMGRLPAAIAALLLAFSPFWVGVFPNGFVSDDTGNSLLTDSPALTLVLLAFWLLLRALDGESVLRFAWAGIALAMSILMRFGSIPSVGMLMLLPLAAKKRWQALMACGAGLLVGLGPYLLWSRAEYGGLLTTLRWAWVKVEGPAESYFYFFRNASNIFSPVAVFGVGLAAAFSLWRLFRALRARPRFPDCDRSMVMLQAYLWLWLVAGFAFFSAMQHKEPRYVMPLAPPFLLLAGSGLALLCAPRLKPMRIAGATLLTILLVLTFLPVRSRFAQPFVDTETPEEMLASQYLESSFPPGTVLYMNFNYPVFAFATNFHIEELPAEGPPLYRAIEQIPPGGVLIAYRENEEMGEPRIDWLNRNPRFQLMRDYSGFAIYRRLVDGPSLGM